MSGSRKKILILSILNLLVVVIYGLLFFDVRTKGVNISDSIGQIEYEIGRVNMMKMTENLIEHTEADRLRLMDFFVAEEGVVDFIEKIEELSQVINLELTIRSVHIEDLDQENNQEFLEILTLNLKAEGDWARVYQFVSLIEKMPYNIHFTKARFLKSPTEGWEADLEMKVVKLK